MRFEVPCLSLIHRRHSTSYQFLRSLALESIFGFFFFSVLFKYTQLILSFTSRFFHPVFIHGSLCAKACVGHGDTVVNNKSLNSQSNKSSVSDIAETFPPLRGMKSGTCMKEGGEGQENVPDK